MTPLLTGLRHALVQTLQDDAALQAGLRQFVTFERPGAAATATPAPGRLPALLVGPAAQVTVRWDGHRRQRLDWRCDLVLWTAADGAGPAAWERLWQLALRALHRSPALAAATDLWQCDGPAEVAVRTPQGQPPMLRAALPVTLSRHWDFRTDVAPLE